MDGFLLYVTPWGHYGLFGCLASPSGDACIYSIILLSFSKRNPFVPMCKPPYRLGQVYLGAIKFSL